MNKVAAKHGKRKGRSNIEAVGGGTPTAPGERAHGSPHGSGVRPRPGSYLTLRPCAHDSSLWELIQVDFIGCLAIPDEVVHATGMSLVDCAFELASWCEALDLPYRDWTSQRSETLDPVVAHGGQS